MSFISDGFDQILEFGSDVWDLVEDGVGSAVDFVAGDGSWSDFAKSWDDALGIDMFDADNQSSAMTEFAPEGWDEENLSYVPDTSESPKPSTQMASSISKTSDPVAESVSKSSEGLFSKFSGDEMLKVGAGVALGYAKDKAERERRKEAHKNRIKELSHQHRLSSAPLKPW